MPDEPWFATDFGLVRISRAESNRYGRWQDIVTSCFDEDIKRVTRKKMDLFHADCARAAKWKASHA